MAIDTGGKAWTYNGSWSSTTIDSDNQLVSLDCVTSTSCAVLDANGYAMTLSGSTWSSPHYLGPTDITTPQVSCGSVTFCEAFDEGDAYTFNGSSWSSGTQVFSGLGLGGLSCLATNYCIAIDGTGFTTSFAEQTQNWTPPDDANGSRAYTAVSCASTTLCIGVGDSGYAAVYNGTSWSSTDIDSTKTLSDVSCDGNATTPFCMAVDTSGDAFEYVLGSGWTSDGNKNDSHSFNAVDCVGTTSDFCAAVGADGYVNTFSGSAWGTAAQKDSTRTLNAVSCASATFCWAVDGSGDAIKYTGSWATATDIDSTRSIDDVSCASTTTCAAVGASGYVVTTTTGGSTWTANGWDATRTLTQVDCPTSSSTCVASDTSGYVVVATYSSSWSESTSDIDGIWAPINSLSCPTSTFCVAVDADGDAISWAGGSNNWVRYGPDRIESVAGVSCTSSMFCAAVDTSGNSLTYGPVSGVTATTQLTWDDTGSLPLLISDGSYDYIFGPTGTPVEQINLSTSSPTYLNYTPQDDTWLATSESGTVAGFWQYDAFGNLLSGTPSSPFGYAGQWTDSTTGFSNLRARSYDAGTGNFTTRDPAFAETDSAYTYATDDPVNGTDPSGLDGQNTLNSLNARFDPIYQTYRQNYAVYQAWTSGCGSGTILSRIGPAFGADIGFGLGVDGLPEDIADGLTTSVAEEAAYDAATSAVDQGLTTAPNEAVFWSGLKGGEETAAEWAAKNGGTTLDMTEGGSILPPWDPNDPSVVSAWRQASAEFAQSASGSVRVLQTTGVRINSTWAEVEYPALKANPNVTSITAINPETGASTVLWSRP